MRFDNGDLCFLSIKQWQVWGGWKEHDGILALWEGAGDHFCKNGQL